jgi:DNA modification methylase
LYAIPILRIMQSNILSIINDKFNVPVNYDWSFAGSRSIDNLTHGYHRYPAKFIPQIVKKLIETYTVPTDKIADVFAGCGTTLVESKVHGRNSVGVDINPVAQLITQAKIHALQPELLAERITNFKAEMAGYDPETVYAAAHHARIDYWFREKEKNEIAFLYSIINNIEEADFKNFFLCALSNILKNCSRWLQRGTKPQIDPLKVIADPFKAMELQLRKMYKKNGDFYIQLQKDNNLGVQCDIKLADARRTKIRANSIGAIITSPPYVTSYEYADIHQLTAYWYEYITDISTFRKNFIGTFYSNNRNMVTKSTIAQNIVTELNKVDTRLAGEVANYFNNMYEVAAEMKRILKPSGVTCLVVGNTTMKDVRIKSAEAFAEMLILLDFEIVEIIKREIPHKINPTIRDKNSGKFTKLTSENKKLIYPEELIIIARKCQ